MSMILVLTQPARESDYCCRKSLCLRAQRKTYDPSSEALAGALKPAEATSGLQRRPVGFPYGFWLCRTEYPTVLNARTHSSEIGHRALVSRRCTFSKPAARRAGRIRYGSSDAPRSPLGASPCPKTPKTSHPIPLAPPNRGVFQQVPQKAVRFPDRLGKGPFFAPVLAHAPDLRTPALSLRPALDPLRQTR